MGAPAGTYALILQATKRSRVTIGKLGKLPVIPGFYAYVGSAFGPGGVEARLNHHRKIASRPHWHMDHLRKHVVLIQTWFTYDNVRREALWAQVLGDMPQASVPLAGFGASDRRNGSHLFYFPEQPEPGPFERLILQHTRGHAPIYCNKETN